MLQSTTVHSRFEVSIFVELLPVNPVELPVSKFSNFFRSESTLSEESPDSVSPEIDSESEDSTI